MPVPAMITYGDRMASFNSQEVRISQPAVGFVAGALTDVPSDGLCREMDIEVWDLSSGRSVVIGKIQFDGEGKQSGASFEGIDIAIDDGLLPDDNRFIDFVERYPAYLPTLGYAQLRREYPTQFPWAWTGSRRRRRPVSIALRPGEVRVAP